MPQSLPASPRHGVLRFKPLSCLRRSPSALPHWFPVASYAWVPCRSWASRRASHASCHGCSCRPLPRPISFPILSHYLVAIPLNSNAPLLRITPPNCLIVAEPGTSEVVDILHSLVTCLGRRDPPLKSGVAFPRAPPHMSIPVAPVTSSAGRRKLRDSHYLLPRPTSTPPRVRREGQA